MDEHHTSQASLDTFDGEAISRADREFLDSLNDHPLIRHPLYSVPPPPAAARFNARLADALFVVVGEAVAEDGHQQAQRRLQYDALKIVIEPSPKARRSYEEKGQRVYACSNRRRQSSSRRTTAML